MRREKARKVNCAQEKRSLHSKWNFISTLTELRDHGGERWPTEVTSDTFPRFLFLRYGGRFANKSSRSALQHQRPRQRFHQWKLRHVVQRCLVVHVLSWFQPQRTVPQRETRVLCWRRELVRLERLPLLRQTRRDEDQACWLLMTSLVGDCSAGYRSADLKHYRKKCVEINVKSVNCFRFSENWALDADSTLSSSGKSNYFCCAVSEAAAHIFYTGKISIHLTAFAMKPQCLTRLPTTMLCNTGLHSGCAASDLWKATWIPTQRREYIWHFHLDVSSNIVNHMKLNTDF